jgi:hypothetical protein
MLVLRAQLLLWKKEGLRDRKADEKRCGIATIQSRFLSSQQRSVHDPLVEADDPAAHSWANDLMKSGPARDRDTLGRLHVYILDTTSLRVSRT